MKITQISIAKLQTPIGGQKLYFDDQLKGFGVYVTKKGIKSYFVQKRMGNKVRRLTMARVNELSVNDARAQAKKILGNIALGNDPFTERQKSKQHITLMDVFKSYLSARKSLKPKTIGGYQRCMGIYLKDWLNKELVEISKEMVLKRHEELAQKHDPATANITMKLLKAVYTFQQCMHDDIYIKNPVNIITQTRAWYKLKVRDSYIKKDQLSDWHKSVMQADPNLRDYLIFILMTGLRRQEAATLTWKQIDFKSLTLTIIDTKNGQPHVLPLTDYLYKFLFYRDQSIKYVFPGCGKAGHILDPRVGITKIIKESGVSFTIHDLRRTFATIADSLNIPGYALKRLLNHRSSNDVTQGYIVADVERLREPLETINRYILAQFNNK